MTDRTLLHYRIVKQLGSGGMGDVYLADDLKLERRVALKLLPPELLRDSQARARFLHEAQTASALDHPNICTVHTIEELPDSRVFIVMASYEGETLKERLARGPLPAGEAAGIALQVAQGLAKAHSLGVIHRDIKPANLFLTEDGLVKILDFGIAKLMDRTRLTQTGGAIGTPLYMSPEQVRGQEMDRRTDIWSLGVVLYELITGRTPFTATDEHAILYAVVNEAFPPVQDLQPGTPNELVLIINRCLQKKPPDRYPAATDLALALNPLAATPSTATLTAETMSRRDRVDTKGICPYPGLASFTEADVDYFHGRESQVETLWQKITRRHLQAVIGPSGTGKTSFLQAGVMAQRPTGWGVVICTPAGSPFLALREALIPDLAGDTAAMKSLLRQQDSDADVAAMRRWRQLHPDALLIVDQFEELFTLSQPEEQARFAELLSRLALEADVHVLLSLRDDFFHRCQDHPGLTPVYESTTVLGQLSTNALRRALEQPALDCGYRFEDDQLAEEIMAEVAHERGALPLLAFAMAQLWKMRDQDKGLLTRKAFTEIGGVGGALARHAEATLDGIGTERVPLVRDMFRNLVTAEGTRAARERDDLLSVFAADQRQLAATVLDALIAARLLTTYEVRDDEGNSLHRVEIVHESLLSAWPRLVRWQAQDAEGALLRDQLRQAARTWQERGRPPDLLWTGSAYQEFTLWRERYPGGLTETEEAYARAMAGRAQRRRQRQRLTVGTVVSLALIVALVTSAFWQRAEQEKQRAEAARLLALGQLELDIHPTAALAYAIASLELADTPEARRFALLALWQGPTEHVLPLEYIGHSRIKFHPSGDWLIATASRDSARLINKYGSLEKSIARQPTQTVLEIDLDLDGHLMVFGATGDTTVQIHAFPSGESQRILKPGLRATFRLADDHLLTISHPRDAPDQIVRKWPLTGEGGGELLGSFEANGAWDIHPSGDWAAVVRGDQVVRVPVNTGGASEEAVLWRTEAEITALRIGPGEANIIAVGPGGLQAWTPQAGAAVWRRLPDVEATPESFFNPCFDSAGTRVAWASSSERATYVWNLEHPPHEEPAVLGTGNVGRIWGGAFSPSGECLAVTNSRSISFWALGQPQVRVVPGHQGHLEFTPDAQWLVTADVVQEGSWLLPLADGAGTARQLINEVLDDYCQAVAVTPSGDGILLGGFDRGLWLVPTGDGEARQIDPRRMAGIRSIAVDPTALRAAVAYSSADTAYRQFIRVFDLKTHAELQGVSFPEDLIRTLAFAHDGTLYSSGLTGVRRWDLTRGTSEILPGLAAEMTGMAMDEQGQSILAAVGRPLGTGIEAELFMLDLKTGDRRRITAHGTLFTCLDLARGIIVTGDPEGMIRVGSATGSEPHLLLGHQGPVQAVAISPDGCWIASSGDGKIRLWPMPDLEKPPLHTLPYAELMARLYSLTNLRVARHPEDSSSYRLEVAPFTGWQNMPTW